MIFPGCANFQNMESGTPMLIFRALAKSTLQTANAIETNITFGQNKKTRGTSVTQKREIVPNQIYNLQKRQILTQLSNTLILQQRNFLEINWQHAVKDFLSLISPT